LAPHLFDQEDQQRRQLAHRLHDTAAQQLAALQINLSLISSVSGTLSGRAVQALADSSELAQACAREIRAVSNRLHPPLLEEAGLPAALRALAGELHCGLSSDFPDEIGELSAFIAINAFRIVEELVLNAKSGRQVVIGLRRQPASLQISVSGVTGLGPAEVARLESLGGTKSIVMLDGNRQVSMEIPLTDAKS
jgi:signal transduction histidine kinase